MKEPNIEVVKLPLPDDVAKLSRTSGLGLALTYHHELSVIHSTMLYIKMYSVPSWVERVFRSGSMTSLEVSNTLSNIMLSINANQLIKLSRNLLCDMAHPYLRTVMQTIQEELRKIDPALAVRLVPDCMYRGGYCFRTAMYQCGKFPVADINHYKHMKQENV